MRLQIGSVHPSGSAYFPILDACTLPHETGHPSSQGEHVRNDGRNENILNVRLYSMQSRNFGGRNGAIDTTMDSMYENKGIPLY